jgi:hypothetical protein
VAELKNDRYLDELQILLLEGTGRDVHISTVWRSLARIGIMNKSVSTSLRALHHQLTLVSYSSLVQRRSDLYYFAHITPWKYLNMKLINWSSQMNPMLTKEIQRGLLDGQDRALALVHPYLFCVVDGK